VSSGEADRVSVLVIAASKVNRTGPKIGRMDTPSNGAGRRVIEYAQS
jgi:hypothetical protein